MDNCIFHHEIEPKNTILFLENVQIFVSLEWCRTLNLNVGSKWTSMCSCGLQISVWWWNWVKGCLHFIAERRVRLIPTGVSGAFPTEANGARILDKSSRRVSLPTWKWECRSHQQTLLCFPSLPSAALVLISNPSCYIMSSQVCCSVYIQH